LGYCFRGWEMTTVGTNKIKKRRRGIYLLPNLCTTAALFSGFYAITAAFHNRFELAAVAIFVSLIMDGLDGRIARLTNTQSEFGAQYDSLSDMMSFAVAPALVMYVWSLSNLGKIGWFAAFVHAAGGALRLARYNAQVGGEDKRYFQGLPSPSAAMLLASFMWVSLEYGYDGETLQYISLIITITSGLLMVSNIRYLTFKEIDFRGEIPFVVAIGMMLSIGMIFAHPPLMVFLLFMVYTISGPLLTVVLLKSRRSLRKM